MKDKKTTRTRGATHKAAISKLLLTPEELAFVFYYSGDGTGAEAVRKSGVPYSRADKTANEMLKRPGIIQALEHKHKAMLADVARAQRTVVDIAKEQGFTLEMAFKKIVTIINSGRHAKRGFADHVQAIKLGSQLAGWLTPLKDAGKAGEPEVMENGVVVEGDKTFFMYRSKWRRGTDQNEGDKVINAPPPPQLPPTAGNAG